MRLQATQSIERNSPDWQGFLIDAGIGCFVESASILALGYFNICIGETRYGKAELDATGMGCSYDEVVRRWRERRRSVFPELGVLPARQMAEAYLTYQYLDADPDRTYCGLVRHEFGNRLIESKVVWAPDGDEAFDDDSCVLQFDIGDQVRIVGFKGVDFEELDDTISEIYLPAVEFYELLRLWIVDFEGLCRRHSPYLQQWKEQNFRFSTPRGETDLI